MTKIVVTKAPKRKQFQSDMDLVQLFEKFSDDDKCRVYLEKLRWPFGVTCIRCDSSKISRIYKRNQFACDACSYQFSVKTGTIFHDSHLPLTKWFAAIFLLSESKKGMSALQLKRTLKVAYKTAWYLCHRIREAVANADTTLLSGIVEVDEAYVGGKPKNMHAKKRENLKRVANYYDNKLMILGALQRGGALRLQHAPTPADREKLHSFIRSKLADEASVIATDEHAGYKGIEDENTLHLAVNHSSGEYVNGMIHTNTLDGVWGLFKRSIVGSYHQISVKHIDRYLNEFEFRVNNRENPYLFRDTLLRLLSTGNLEYKELIASEPVMDQKSV